MRCPRCNGFLYDSVQRYELNTHIYKGMKHCLNCGRDWRLSYRGKGKWVITQWPDVERLRKLIEETKTLTFSEPKKRRAAAWYQKI